jgi:site-specific DNA-methyltransferase (adenine-specific)
VIHHGDCLDVMAAMEPESVAAIVTDPPYGLRFMGKAWDHGAPGVPFWSAMLRVAAPSAYLLAFGGTRTVHRMTVAIEDAGWIIRDMLVWAYASGFPKSKASLKPAWEPIVMARKPGPLRELAIDACRIGFEPMPEIPGELGVNGIYGRMPRTARRRSLVADTPAAMGKGAEMGGDGSPLGRWPANVILTDPIFDGGIEGVVGGGETSSGSGVAGTGSGEAAGLFGIGSVLQTTYGDSGTYSRFFLIPKADRAEREPVGGIIPRRPQAPTMGDWPNDVPAKSGGLQRANVHPTVKPVDLMRHLVRLVTPSGGTVLDPFLGSGTTGIACEMEGFDWIGIEKEAEYVAIARARLEGVQRGFGLSA